MAQATRALKWALGAAAITLVAWVVPVRDRCQGPEDLAGPRAPMSREAEGCVLHTVPERRLSRAECGRLRCEPGLVSAFLDARLGILAGLLGIYLGGTLVWAARWRVLLGMAGLAPTLREVWRVTVEAQAGGVLLPGGVGGDAFRIASMSDRGAPIAKVVASVLLDRVIGLVTLALLAVTLGIVFGGLGAGPLVAFLGAIPLASLAGLLVVRRVPAAWLGRLPGALGRAFRPMLEYVRDPGAPRAITLAAALSLGVSAIQLVTVRGIALALGASELDEPKVYVGAAMAFIASAVPGLPGGWGTADAAFVFFLGAAGAAASVALATSLLYRLFWYVSALIGAVLAIASGAKTTKAQG